MYLRLLKDNAGHNEAVKEVIQYSQRKVRGEI